MAKLPALRVDFTKTPIENILNAYPTDTLIANQLGGAWTPTTIRTLNSQHGIYTDVPILCIGRKSCPFTVGCIIPEDSINEFEGKACPIELMEATRLFVGYVKELEISPDDFTDLQLVMDLIRLHIHMKRCDLYQKSHPIFDMVTAGVNQKTGAEVLKPEISLGFKMSREVRRDIGEKYKQLIASRKDKLDKSVKESKVVSNTGNFMSQILKKAKETNEQGNEQQTCLPGGNIEDADEDTASSTGSSEYDTS
jgi:hypothetical protein